MKPEKRGESVSSYEDACAAFWASQGVEVTTRFVTLPELGTRLHVTESGEGPPIVLVHGGAVSGPSWAQLVAQLPDFRCITIDRPGCGLSEPSKLTDPTVAQFKDYADRLLVDVLDALELDTAHLIGTSGGGYFTHHAMAASPERFNRMVEFSWPFGAPMTSIPLIMRLGAIPAINKFSGRMPILRPMVNPMLKQIGLADAVRNNKIPDEMVDWFVALVNKTSTMQTDDLTRANLIPLRGFNEEVWLSDELLASITAPTLYLWGENDPNGGPEAARAFTARLPNAELELFPGAGHAPWIDEPELLGAKTREFLSAG